MQAIWARLNRLECALQRVTIPTFQAANICTLLAQMATLTFLAKRIMKKLELTDIRENDPLWDRKVTALDLMQINFCIPSRIVVFRRYLDRPDPDYMNCFGMLTRPPMSFALMHQQIMFWLTAFNVAKGSRTIEVALLSALSAGIFTHLAWRRVTFMWAAKVAEEKEKVLEVLEDCYKAFELDISTSEYCLRFLASATMLTAIFLTDRRYSAFAMVYSMFVVTNFLETRGYFRPRRQR